MEQLQKDLAIQIEREGYNTPDFEEDFSVLKEYCEDNYETGRWWVTKRPDGFSKTHHYIIPFDGDSPYIEVQFITDHFGNKNVKLFSRESNGIDITISPELYQRLDQMNMNRKNYNPIQLTSDFIVQLLEEAYVDEDYDF